MIKNIKKYLSILLCVVLVASSLSALGIVSAVTSGVNLVTNGDFEADLNGWTAMWSGKASILDASSAYAVSGKTLCVDGYSGAYQIINVEQNTTYAVSANLRTTAQNATHLRIYAGAMTDPNQVENVTPMVQSTVAADTWANSVATAAVEFNSGENTQITLYFVNNTGNIATIDNVVMEEIVVGEVVNGDFEADLNGWTAMWSGKASILDASSAYAVSGKTLCVDGYSGAYQIINVEQNTTYAVSANLRTTAKNATHLRIYAGAMTDPNQVENVTPMVQSTVAADTWANSIATAAVEFNSGENTQITLYFVNNTGNIATVDNVVMEEVVIEEEVVGEIVNGDFEADLNGWTPMWAGKASIIDASNAYAISGKTLCVDRYSGAYQVINVEANTTYTVSADMRTTAQNATHLRIYAGTALDPNQVDKNSITPIAQSTVTVDTWANSVAKPKVTFNSGSNTQITIYFVNNSGNIATIDNVVMEEVVVGEFANGDFESGTVEPWVDASGTGLTIVDSTDSYKITGNTLALAQGGTITQTVEVDANSRYMFDASVFTNAKNGIYFRVYSGYSVAADKLLAETVCKSQTWNQKVLGLAGTFETGESEVVTLCIYNANGAAWVDDIILTKIESTVNEALVNGDFETGDTTGWITTNNASVYTPDNGAYFINGNAISLNTGDAAIQYVNVKPNTAYYYHMLVRMPNYTASEINGLVVRVLSGAKELTSEVYNTFNEHVNQTHNAAVVDGVFVTDSTGVVKLMLQNDHKQLVIVDDVALAEVKEFANGDFENGFDGWNPSSSGYVDTATDVYSNSIIDSGDYAISGKTVQFGKEGSITRFIKVTPNTVYGFTAKGRTGANPYLSIKVFGGSNYDTLLTTSDLETTTWADTPINIEGVFNSGDNEYVKISVSNGSTTNTAWIDDISLLTQESESPISLHGTSVLYRLYNDAQGLRFAFEIPDKGESFNMYGGTYEVVASGTLVGVLDNFGEITAYEALSIGSELAVNCANSRTYIKKDSKIVYTALITDITEDDAYTTFAARPYIVAKDTNGNTRVFYGAVVESDLGTAYESMSDAEKALVAEDAIIF